MASLQAKIGWKCMRIEKIKIIITFCSNPTSNRKFQKNSKKIAKKFKKIKNTVTYTFQAKIGLKKMRKRENNNYHFVPFLLNAKLKIPKKQQ